MAGSRNRQPSATGSRADLGKERRRLLIAYLGKKDTEKSLPSGPPELCAGFASPRLSAPASTHLLGGCLGTAGRPACVGAPPREKHIGSFPAASHGPNAQGRGTCAVFEKIL